MDRFLLIGSVIHLIDTARFLGFHHDQIRKMVRAGRFPEQVVSLLPGSRVYRFDPEELKRWAFREFEDSSVENERS